MIGFPFIRGACYDIGPSSRLLLTQLLPPQAMVRIAYSCLVFFVLFSCLSLSSGKSQYPSSTKICIRQAYPQGTVPARPHYDIDSQSDSDSDSFELEEPVRVIRLKKHRVRRNPPLKSSSNHTCNDRGRKNDQGNCKCVDPYTGDHCQDCESLALFDTVSNCPTLYSLESELIADIARRCTMWSDHPKYGKKLPSFDSFRVSGLWFCSTSSSIRKRVITIQLSRSMHQRFFLHARLHQLPHRRTEVPEPHRLLFTN